MLYLKKHLFIFLLIVCKSACAQSSQTVTQEVDVTIHEVQRGESLEDITTKYGITEDELKKYNPGFDLFYTGMTINIPAKTAQTAAYNTSVDGVNTKSNGDERILDYISETVKADEILSNGDYKKANKAYTGIIKRYGEITKCTDAYYGRALASYNRGKWKAAIKDFEMALSDNEFNGAERRQCDRLLAKARQQREEQLERRGEMWAGLVAVGLATTTSIIAAKEASKNSSASSSSSMSGGSTSSSSYEYSDDEGNTSISTSSSGTKCGVCQGTGSIIEYAANYGIDKRPYCEECGKTVTSGHYHKTCTYCGGKGYK